MRLGQRLSRVGLLMATLTLAGGAISIHASTINSSWNGGTGNWSVSADWTPHGVPNNGGLNLYNVTIDSGGSDSVSLDINATIASLVLGGTSGSSTLQNLSGKAERLEVTGATTINRTGVLTFGNASTLKLDGGLTLASGSFLEVSGGSGLTVTGSLTNMSTLETASGSGNKLTVNGNLTNGGSLFLLGTADTLTVTGTLTNNTGGTLGLETSGDVANISKLMNSGSVSVFAGTTLNLTSALSNSGTVNISGGTGILTDKGAYTQNSAGALGIDIGGKTVFDHLTISGAASLNGALNVAEISGFTPTVGETFDIMNFASKTGTFSSCNGHSGGSTCTINSTEHFMVEYNGTNVTLLVVNGASPVTLGAISGATGWASSAQAARPAPEPSTLLMLSSGLLLLAHYARSRAAGKGSRRTEVKA